MSFEDEQTKGAESPTAKILAIVTAIASQPGSGLTAIAQQTGLPKATVHRIVGELERLDWIHRSPGQHGLGVGSSLLRTALDTVHARFKQTVANTILRNLAEELGETCTVGIADGSEVVFLETVQPAHPISFVFPKRSRAPLYCSSTGRVFLAEMSEEAFERYLEVSVREKFTPHTTVDPAILRQIIEGVRKNGYAKTNNEWVMHVVGAAVPIRDTRGRCIAALT